MGVTGLWTVLQPCARPIKLETLNKKRLAVDASIWIYQFLKAVRDKEGHALRNAHVVGFFRRICKLLFVGVQPVFVFDGGAPALKRQTVGARRARREGRRVDAVRTAGKLLAVQMKRRAEEEEARRREERDRGGAPAAAQEEEEIGDEANLVYANEVGMTEQERQRSRKFKKKDQYHLPELDVGFAHMGAPNDPRVMSQEELEAYAAQFHTGEDVNLYDFSKIDFDGAFFASLPATDRYNILNAARLRSRLRMGYSKEQLDTMFPDRMAFSRFQVDRVRERNELTQRLMNLNGMSGVDALSVNGRVAGEKGKEYVLVKNDGVEGGWALGVVSNRNEGQQGKPINVDEPAPQPRPQDESEEEDGLEDVPIEGLNRLPKPPQIAIDGHAEPTENSRKRQALYNQRKRTAASKAAAPASNNDPETLFVPNDSEQEDDLFEDVLPQEQAPEEDDDLRLAIAMSLDQDNADATAKHLEDANAPIVPRDVDVNEKGPFMDDSDDDEYSEVLNATPVTTRDTVTRHKPTRAKQDEGSPTEAPTKSEKRPQFDGPLPFESLNFGKSILGRKKGENEVTADQGGFQKEAEEEARPLPPWFSGDIREGAEKQKASAIRESQATKHHRESQFVFQQPVLGRKDTREIIDVDEPKAAPVPPEVVDVESSDGEDDVVMGEMKPAESDARMDDVADLVRAEPPPSDHPSNLPERQDEVQEQIQPPKPEAPDNHTDEEVEWSESDHEPRLFVKPADGKQEANETDSNVREKSSSPEFEDVKMDDSAPAAVEPAGDAQPAGGELKAASTRSSSPNFEDVEVRAEALEPAEKPPVPALPHEEALDHYPDDDGVEDDMFSDPEDEELMKQLADEAEEHARFAATLNAGSRFQTAEDYERELRQLRNQQKKDRRDADEVTQIMVAECQQLLRLFGLPYVTAPMEAEAQCAELVRLGLVDGVVTDDSDVFLFGGARVYKNMFNQAKFVECYLAADLARELALPRARVVQLAHLLGSDYAEGLPGVGPVTALEILSEFGDLDAFRDWWTGVQRNPAPPTDPRETKGFRKKFRKNATKLFLPPAFPDRRVDAAYLRPEVDSDPSAFAWGVPDLAALRAFLTATVGWSQERADEILVPVIRDMNRRATEGTQANITRFFAGGVGSGSVREKRGAAGEDGGQAYAPRRRAAGKSRRMEDALGRLHEQAQKEGVDRDVGVEGGADVPPETRTNGRDEGEPSRHRARRGRGKRKADATPNAPASSAAEESSGEEEEHAPPKKRAAGNKRGARRRNKQAS